MFVTTTSRPSNMNVRSNNSSSVGWGRSAVQMQSSCCVPLRCTHEGNFQSLFAIQSGRKWSDVDFVFVIGFGQKTNRLQKKPNFINCRPSPGITRRRIHDMARLVLPWDLWCSGTVVAFSHALVRHFKMHTCMHNQSQRLQYDSNKHDFIQEKQRK